MSQCVFLPNTGFLLHKQGPDENIFDIFYFKF